MHNQLHHSNCNKRKAKGQKIKQKDKKHLTKRSSGIRKSAASAELTVRFTKKMDRTEILAEQYLKKLGYEPVFEPLGYATCPDFQIAADTAVEVRRLNENSFLNEIPEGLQIKDRQVTDLVNKAFKQVTRLNPTRNYWVVLRFRRPIEPLKKIKKQLHDVLNDIIENDVSFNAELEVTNSIKLKLLQKENLEEQIFHLGIISDIDSGGFVIPILLKNIDYCIKEKIKKIQCCRKKYDNWWLILIDEISYGLNEKDREYIKTKIEVDPALNTVVILNTLNGKEILKI